MRITLFSAGSQGDVLPLLRLGVGLQRAGSSITLAVPRNFAAMAEAKGLRCQPLRADVQLIMAGDVGKAYMESGGANPIRSILAMQKMIGPVAEQMFEDTLDACREADALITPAVFAPFAATVAEIRGLPLILIEPTPLLPTGAFPAAGWPIQRSLGAWANRLSGHAMLAIIWQWYRPFVNALRRRHGLRALAGSDFERILTSVPVLGAYSPAVVSAPSDWPANVRVTGYWFDDAHLAWTPSAELQRFLDHPSPPVYVGFGSMAGRRPERLARIVLEALALSGQRAVVATGWGGLGVKDAPAEVCIVNDVPHGWLFERLAAVVHHGGAGTTGEGLRAGKPTVVVPFIVDQLFWGKRVEALGAGPAPTAARQLTAARLAAAIDRAVHDPALRQRSQAIGRAIRADDGLACAVAAIQHNLGA